MNESIIVIILLFIIGLIVFAVLANTAKQRAATTLAAQTEEQAFLTAQSAANLYELRCAKTGTKAACIDTAKATTLAMIIQTDPAIKDYYRDRFGNALITIEQLYPSGARITLYNETPTAQHTTRTIALPTSIYDPMTETMHYGLLTISTYTEVTA